MKILALTQIKTNQTHLEHSKKNKNERNFIQNNTTYNPIYYKDYSLGINFKGQFSDPEAFYERYDNVMPNEMRKYLYENYPDRVKLAPMQLLHETYHDINRKDITIEEIRKRFPETFGQIKSEKDSGATRGILYNINETRKLQGDKPIPLFKNGMDDLTVYFIKKIYIEGKCLREIDEDFGKEVNNLYDFKTREARKVNDMTYFTHDTVKALGIPFPDRNFMLSLLATRDYLKNIDRVYVAGRFMNRTDFNKQYPPRIGTSPHVRGTVNTTASEVANIGRELADVVSGKKDFSSAQKYLGKNVNNEAFEFMNRYAHEIMVLATENCDISGKIIEFNKQRKMNLEQFDLENSITKSVLSVDNSSKKTSAIKLFWNANNEFKQEFGRAISESFHILRDAYNTSDAAFRAVLDNVYDIEERRYNHNLNAQKYKELAKEFMNSVPEKVPPVESLNVPGSSEDRIKTVQQKLEELTDKYERLRQGLSDLDLNDVKIYNIGDERLVMTADLHAIGREQLQLAYHLLPKDIFDSFMKELETTFTNDDLLKFYLTISANTRGISFKNDNLDHLMFSLEDIYNRCDKTCALVARKEPFKNLNATIALVKATDKQNVLSDKLISELLSKYMPESLSASGSNMSELISAYRRDFVHQSAGKIAFDVASLATQSSTEFDLFALKRNVNECYREISKPLNDKELKNVANKIIEMIKSFNFNLIHLSPEEQACINSIKDGVLISSEHAKVFKDVHKNARYVNGALGSNVRYLLEENGNIHLKGIILKKIMLRFWETAKSIR